MKKLIAALMAGLFSVAYVGGVIAADDKKDSKMEKKDKGEKKDKKGEAK
jgi:hypothetical protein